MIRTDGDRSLKRLWFAKKKLAQIQEMDIPVKRINLEGFDIKVWQMGELSGGSINAPMGAVVARVDGHMGLQVAVADYWVGAVSMPREVYGLKKDDGYIGHFAIATEEQILALGYETIPFYPLQIFAHDDLLLIYLFPTPGITPYYGESYDITYKGIVAINSAPDGEPENYNQFKDMYERSRSFYLQDNTGLQRRATTFLQSDTFPLSVFGTIAPHNEVYSLCQQMNQEQQVFSMAYRYNVISDVKAAIFRTTIPAKYDPEDPTTFPLGETVPISYMIPSAVIPAALRNIMLDITQITIEPICTYAFLNNGSQALLTVVNATGYDYHRVGSPSGDLATYYDTNPSDYNWRLFFSLWDGTTVSTHTVSQFGSLLETLSNEDPAIDNLPDPNEDYNTKMMLAVLQRISSVWPNQHPDSPYDSAMFHAHTGDVYSWSRLYGMLVFSTAGLSRSLSANVPVIVSSETGCRPEIYYSGTYSETPVYICFANKVNVNILGVYVGSPFTSWFALPSMPEGYVLIQCRPVVVRPDAIFLIGIAKAGTELFFTSIRFTVPEDETIETMTMPDWGIQSKLPFVHEEYNLTCYQVGLFGEDQMVNELRNFASPPPVLSQMPWTPYYSIYDSLWGFEI